jgi:hypothetical protein
MKSRQFLLCLLAACGGGGTSSDPDASSPAPACPVEGYAACGGALSGTWRFAGLCPESPDAVPCESPFSDEPACTAAGNTTSCVLVPEGALTFDGANVHVVRTLTAETTYVFSDDCLAAVRTEATPEERCAGLDRPPALACSYAAGACTCLGSVEDEPIDATVAYTVTGNDLAFDEFTATYCVDGDVLTLDFDPHPQSWRYWLLARGAR